MKNQNPHAEGCMAGRQENQTMNTTEKIRSLLAQTDYTDNQKLDILWLNSNSNGAFPGSAGWSKSQEWGRAYKKFLMEKPKLQAEIHEEKNKAKKTKGITKWI